MISWLKWLFKIGWVKEKEWTECFKFRQCPHRLVIWFYAVWKNTETGETRGTCLMSPP
jgi:hypothetical protein